MTEPTEPWPQPGDPPRVYVKPLWQRRILAVTISLSILFTLTGLSLSPTQFCGFLRWNWMLANLPDDMIKDILRTLKDKEATPAA